MARPVNGVAHSVLRVAELLTRSGHEPVVIAPRPQETDWLRGIHNGAARTLAPSTVTAASLHARGIDNVWLGGRGVDTVRFHPARRSPELRAQLAPGGELIVGYVGRLATEKRVDLLAGITALDGVRLVIVGAGPAEGMLRQQMPDAIFLGERRGEELAALYASLDVFAHSGPEDPASLVVAGDGFVPDRAELAALLARADVVLAPGPTETFGLAALACGTRTPGVRTAPGGGWRGWAALLAATLDQPDLRNLATLGALASDVERFQRPAALAVKPDVASVIVGINDTLRGDFDPERTGAAVDRTVAALRATGAEVLTVRLPDPGQMFGLPGALARPLARRMRAVNTVVDQVALRYRTIHLDAARDPATCAGRPGREGMASRRRRSSRDSCADRAIRRRLGVRRARGRYGDPSTGGRSRRGP